MVGFVVNFYENEEKSNPENSGFGSVTITIIKKFNLKGFYLAFIIRPPRVLFSDAENSTSS